jgi:cytochrome c
MKKTFIILSCVALASCGGGNSSNASDKKDSSTSTTATAPATNAGNEKALELIGSSDCTTCHKLDKAAASGSTIGPAYSEVAAKYAPAADTTVERIVKKIISGGSGVWGSVPMTPHPALKEADVKTIVDYILTLKK